MSVYTGLRCDADGCGTTFGRPPADGDDDGAGVTASLTVEQARTRAWRAGWSTVFGNGVPDDGGRDYCYSHSPTEGERT